MSADTPMRTILPLLIAFVFLTPCFGQSQAEMNIQMAEELEKEDKILNSVYQRLLKERAGEPQFCSDLRQAQRAWLKFVDLHLASVFSLEEGEELRGKYGSIMPSEYAMIKIELIQTRVKQLEGLLIESTHY